MKVIYMEYPLTFEHETTLREFVWDGLNYQDEPRGQIELLEDQIAKLQKVFAVLVETIGKEHDVELLLEVLHPTRSVVRIKK